MLVVDLKASAAWSGAGWRGAVNEKSWAANPAVAFETMDSETKGEIHESNVKRASANCVKYSN
jgi:hypothetical protein